MKLFRFVCSVWVACVAWPVLGQDGQQGDEGILYYDAASGEIFLDIQSENGRIVGFDFRSDQSLIDTANYQRMGGPTIILSITEHYLTDAAGLGTDRPDGLYGMGAIYPTGVAPSDFIADVDSNWGRPGTSAFMPFDIEFGRPTGIPRNDPSLPPLHTSWAESVNLKYVAPTGELILDTSGDQGGFITHFVLQGDFLSQNAVSPGFDLWEATDELIYGLGAIDEGVYNLGPVLQPGLTAAELSTALGDSGWKGPAGVGISGFDVQSSAGSIAFALVHIPEPSSHLLSLMGALAVTSLARRRRRTAGVL